MVTPLLACPLMVLRYFQWIRPPSSGPAANGLAGSRPSRKAAISGHGGRSSATPDPQTEPQKSQMTPSPTGNSEEPPYPNSPPTVWSIREIDRRPVERSGFHTHSPRRTISAAANMFDQRFRKAHIVTLNEMGKTERPQPYTVRLVCARLRKVETTKRASPRRSECCDVDGGGSQILDQFRLIRRIPLCVGHLV